MRPGGRISAAIDVLTDIEQHHRPASVALADWGRSHRFAGSGDRAAIGNLVFDALRNKRSLAARMGADTPRALILAASPAAFGLSPDEIARLAADDTHGPGDLSDAERAGLARDVPGDAPDDVRGDIPQWLAPAFRDVFGDDLAAEGAAMAARAPLDVRVNTLKADRDKVRRALAKSGAEPTPFSPIGLRIAARPGAGRMANVEAEASHGRGWFEVQDEGSQIASLMSGAGPREQVMDLCAGAGGKTLAMAAMMQNTGQLFAYDADKTQLRPIFDRIRRAGVRNVTVMDGGDEAALDALAGRFDRVFVDAPCTGSGTWRRRPDAKWRLTEAALTQRLADQRSVLARAAALAKPGGIIVYVTCSVLSAENEDQLDAFYADNPGDVPVDLSQVAACDVTPLSAAARSRRHGSVLLTPHRTGTDGFFIAAIRRAS